MAQKGCWFTSPDATVMTFDISFRAGDYLVEKQKWENATLDGARVTWGQMNCSRDQGTFKLN
jgi:hypothetical protein